VPDFTDPAALIDRSQQDLFALISDSAEPHPFAALSEADRWAALDAVRAFGYTYAAPGELLAEKLGTITGQVVNRTAGAAPPAGLEVNLHGFDGQSLLTTLTTTAAADGAFTFAAVPYAPGRQFVVTAQYQDITYGSDLAAFGAPGEPLDIVLPVYEKTSDSAVLVVEQMHMFLEFVSPGEVTVGQLFIFANPTDRTYAASGADLLQFNLPPEAAGLDVQNAVLDQDYFRNADGFGALWQVQPGEAGGQILFSFRLPYDDLLNFSQVMHYPVRRVNVLVSDLGVDLSGPGLQDLGPQVFEDQSFQNFDRAGLAAGETLSFEVRGAPGTASTAGTAAPRLETSTTGLAIGLGGLALALVGIGLWLYRRPARPDPAREREALIQAIADLDDAYAGGEIDPADYAAERAELKADLVELWDESGDAEIRG
jgi:hypothetical protein